MDMLFPKKGGCAPCGTVFFDYDGTLHDCMRIYGPAFRRAYDWLVERGHARPQQFTDEWISRWLGWTVRDMWEAFMPELPEDVWHPASRLVGEEMDCLLENGQGALFAGAPEALDVLVGCGYELVFLSNCGEAYCEKHRRVFGLDRWFSGYYCAGSYPGLAKWQIYAQKACDLHPKPHVVAGDRFHDVEVALRASIPSVGCAYGFGEVSELERATVLAQSPADLPAAVERALAGCA